MGFVFGLLLLKFIFMTVGELKLLLELVDDDLLVLMPANGEYDGHFISPCMNESGIVELGDDEDNEDDFEPSFLLVPHEFFEEKVGVPPELN